MSERVPELLVEIRGNVERLEANLPRRIDAASVSPRTKLPFLVVHYREALAWRCAELAREALDAIERDRLAAGTLLTRAVVETAAAQWYLRLKVGKAVDSGDIAEIKSIVNRLVLGSRTSPEMPQAINVLAFIDAASKKVEGLREQFDRLCEVAHPNWVGTTLLYSKPSLEERAVEFGRNIRSGDGIRTVAVVNLSIALLMFELAYDGIADLLEGFVKMCDANPNAV